VWPRAELETLAAGLRDAGRDDIFILSDEVYREIHFGDESPPSPAELHANTLIASSLSKSNSLTGLRLGWLRGPPEVVAAATKVHQFVNTAASTFSQRVALELLASSMLGDHREHYRGVRTTLLDECFAADLSVIEPEGAFYAFIRLPPPFASDSVVAAETLLERERVVTVPGAAFGESGEGWLRISWVAPEDALREGIRRIGRFLNENGPRFP
jgi:aminotransferase